MKTIIIDGVEYNLTHVVKEKTYNDWRLPTIKELQSLVNFDKHNPASDLEDTQNNLYWSSSTVVGTSYYNWVVSFYHGGDNNATKNDDVLVRCVRDGENGLEWSTTSTIRMTWDEAIEYAKNLVAPVYYKG